VDVLFLDAALALAGLRVAVKLAAAVRLAPLGLQFDLHASIIYQVIYLVKGKMIAREVYQK
jgi:hypothetical protein